MTRRPKTLDEVDWEAATDAYVRAARHMTLAEVRDHAERGAAQLEADGNPEGARVYRSVAAVLNRRLAH